MLTTIIFFAIILCLLWAGIIDLKHKILPNELMLTFAALACIFHVSANFTLISYSSMIIGGGAACALMLAIRFGAHMVYKTEALGLGDVKLLTAAGIWLGVTDFMLALSIGAAAGLIHGLILTFSIKAKTGTAPPLSHLTIPAGPGFIAGILITAAIAFGPTIF